MPSATGDGIWQLASTSVADSIYKQIPDQICPLQSGQKAKKNVRLCIPLFFALYKTLLVKQLSNQ
jgi:hypothetical protein